MKNWLNLDGGGVSLRKLAGLWSPERMAEIPLFRAQYPPLALEVSDGKLTLVHVERERRKPPALRRYREIPLDAELLRTRFSSTNLARPADVAQAIRRALEDEGIEAHGASLVLPDHLARVALIHLGERPTHRAEILEMIRWKLRKAVPFKVEDAHIDYQIVSTPGETGAWTCLATLVLQSVLDEYESLLDAVGLHPGLIDLSTFNLVNLCLPSLNGSPEDVFILNITEAFFSLMIVRSGTPLFYRAKSYRFVDEAGRESPEDTVALQMASSLSYYHERLAGATEGRFFLRCVDLDVGAMKDALERRLERELHLVDPAGALEVHPREADPAVHARMMQRIAPALGAALGRDQ